MGRIGTMDDIHSPEASQEKATDKEKHEFLAAILKETRYGLVDFMFKHGAVVMLFLGWIVSSR